VGKILVYDYTVTFFIAKLGDASDFYTKAIKYCVSGIGVPGIALKNEIKREHLQIILSSR